MAGFQWADDAEILTEVDRFLADKTLVIDYKTHRL